MISIAENVAKIRDKIAEAAALSGRVPDDITLVAASKMKSADEIREAIAAGIDAVGENRVQELLSKEAQGAYSGVPLHFIGHLQSNKVSKIVGVCDLIESVGSKNLLEAISKRARKLGIIQNVLLEVNIGKEERKSGIYFEETSETLEFASQISGINILGLMAIPPIFDEKSKNSHYFDIMCNLFVDMSKKTYDNVTMRFLSMGMSDSYFEAICAGANMVRIGSAIFGDRNNYVLEES